MRDEGISLNFSQVALQESLGDPWGDMPWPDGRFFNPPILTALLPLACAAWGPP